MVYKESSDLEPAASAQSFKRIKWQRDWRDQEMIDLDLSVQDMFRLMNNRPVREISPAGKIVIAGH